jgi:L-aspartate oxidase
LLVFSIQTISIMFQPRWGPRINARFHESDTLVIGSGIAGLSYALQAAAHGTVSILTKSAAEDTSTRWAQGGIAAVTHPNDRFDCHVDDTLTAGAGLCHRDSVEVLVHEGPQAIRSLVEWGVQFTRVGGARSEFDLHREGGHGTARILHAQDITGAEIERALLEAIRTHPNIRLMENRLALELITPHFLKGTAADRPLSCHGVYALVPESGLIETWSAPVTVLCTGGVGQVYQHTTNPNIATGDGIAMAWRAGARIANMEFIQFHPTMLYDPARPSFLVSEAVRGAGAILRDSRGIAFMAKEHHLKDLAPRDIVARAIDRRMKELGDPCVYLDLSALASGEAKKKFPTIYARCLEAGIRMDKDLVPVVPSAHYLCGGIDTDLHGQTSIPGLYAVGECAHTGVHGANRLASNSLLEAVVFAKRALTHALENPRKKVQTRNIQTWDRRGTQVHREEIIIRHELESVRRLMWDYVGIVRCTDRLLRARRKLNSLLAEIEVFYKQTVITPSLLELRNIARTAALIVDSAIKRKESRGLHSTLDFPDQLTGKPKDTRLRHKV